MLTKLYNIFFFHKLIFQFYNEKFISQTILSFQFVVCVERFLQNFTEINLSL